MDVLIIGGGPAGLSAALMLGRARRQVLVLDAGAPRHAVSSGVHNFVTRDGLPPAALREVAWQQMATYPTVSRAEARIVSLERQRDRWVATSDTGSTWQGRVVLLATGVVDVHFPIPGYAERWGHAIHHCPYCHGWEVRDQPLGLVAHGEVAEMMAPLLRNWSADVAVFTHGTAASDALRQIVQAREIPLFEAAITGLHGSGRELQEVHLADGQVVRRHALFVHTPQRQIPLVDKLGVALTPEGYVDVDPMQHTSVPGVWAAGDLTTRYQQVVEAAAQGSRAAGAIHMALTPR